MLILLFLYLNLYSKIQTQINCSFYCIYVVNFRYSGHTTSFYFKVIDINWPKNRFKDRFDNCKNFLFNIFFAKQHKVKKKKKWINFSPNIPFSLYFLIFQPSLYVTMQTRISGTIFLSFYYKLVGKNQCLSLCATCVQEPVVALAG